MSKLISNRLLRQFDLSSGVSPYLLFTLICVVALDGCGSPEDLILKPHLEAKWQTLDATTKSLQGRMSPADWSAGLYIGSSALNAALERLKGTKLEYAPADSSSALKGTVIEVRSLKVQPETGYAGVEVSLQATHGDAVLDLDMIADISYLGVERVAGGGANENVEIRLRVEPLEVKPKIRLGFFRFGLSDFWAHLAPDLAVAFANPSLFEVKIPAPDAFTWKLAIDETKTDRVNKETGATITYTVKMPESIFAERVSYSGFVFRPDGFWFLARVAAEGQTPVAPAAMPSMDARALVAEVEKRQKEYEVATKAFALAPDVVALRVGRDVFERLGNQIAEMPDDKRRITIQSTGATGQLAKTTWRDNLLGDGGAYAELAAGDRAHAVLQFGKPTVAWSSGALVLKMDARATLNADVRVHFDPLIGGGMGTTIGFDGNGGGTLSATGTPKLMTAGDIAAAVMHTALSCDAVQAVVQTDGRLKIDLGWIRVPQVGAKAELPLGRHQLGELLLVDNRPRFVSLMPGDAPAVADGTAAPGKASKGSSWIIKPASPALKVRIVPKSIAVDDTGFAVTVAIESAPIDVSPTKEALADAKAAIDKEGEIFGERVKELLAKAPATPTCEGEPTIAVLLGPIEMGPNNEIVKFARNAWNDFTKGPGPNNELRKAVEAAKKALEPLTPYIAVGKGHGGLGVQIGSWKF